MKALYLQPPHSPGNEVDANWKGRSVRLAVAVGSTGTLMDIQPKLEWSTLAGGSMTHIMTTSIPLLKIHSILTHVEMDDESKEDDGIYPEGASKPRLGDHDSNFLTITSESGDVHMFEADTLEERDNLVNGLRNVCARLAFHLITGDATASTELYDASMVAHDGDLSSLPNPRLNMNRIAHAMLD